MPVTHQDIAEKLGVSRRLVGLALNDEVGVGAEMRARIIDLADELGYRTNRAAKALVTGRSNQIALCLPSLSVPFHVQFIHHFEALMRHTPYDLLVTTTMADLNSLPTVDGVLLQGSMPSGKISQPTVLIQSPPVFTMPEGMAKVDQVFLDLNKASKAVMSHLLELKKSRLAYVTWLTMPDEPRLLAYQQAMNQANLPLEIITIDCQWPDDIRSATHQTLEQYFVKHGFPDALFCCNDEVAIGAYRALRRLDRKIPNETAVVGCDDIPETQELYPALSTIRHAWADFCQSAWELLLNRIENPSTPPQQTFFPGELIIRDSSVPQ